MTVDAICNIVQVAGGALFGVSQSGNSERAAAAGGGGGGGGPPEPRIDPSIGINVLKAGLALQVASWVIFITFLVVAIQRAYSHSTARQHLREKRYDPLRWYLLTVLLACIFILWRACYRLAEAITGMS